MREFEFDYIDESLEKIKNPNDVDIIKIVKSKCEGYSLYARINNGDAVQLTEVVGGWNFPVEPIRLISRELGRFYWEDFGIIHNQIAINKSHLTELQYLDLQQLDPKSRRVALYANFDDGNLIFLVEPRKKYFFRELKPEMEQKFGMQFKDVTQEAIEQQELEKYL